MRKLIIIGAGNVGGYIAYNAREFGSYEIVGFLDDDISKRGKNSYGHQVIGTVDSIEKLSEERDLSVVVAISSPIVKASIISRLAGFDLDFPTFVARNAWLSKSVSIGKGVVIYPGVSINYETTISDFVTINMNCAVGHNCEIARYVTLAPGVNLGGFTIIEEEANLGIGVSTRQNVRIGKSAVIGGQSMVVNNVSGGAVAVGIPAREITR